LAATGVQVHQFQQDDDAAVIHAEQVRQGSGRLRSDVFHLLPRFRAARLPAVWNAGRRIQQLPHGNVRINFVLPHVCRGGLGRLAAWHLPGGPVGPASRWATISNV